MSINAHKLLRYKILDECFRDTSRLYNTQALLECCNAELMHTYGKKVSLRTIQNDIQLLRYEPYNAEFDEDLLEQGFYRYADTSQQLTLLRLTETSRDALAKAVDELRSVVDNADTINPQQQWMFFVLQSIARDKDISMCEHIVGFENNSVFAGNIHFATCLECVANRQPITVKYRPYQHPHAEVINLHPYYLRQYNSRWFLFACADGNATITTLALDRIVSIKIWKRPFIPSNVDFSTYFDHIIGVSIPHDAKVDNIVLRIDNARYPYIETKPFCEQQRIVAHNEKTHTISFPMKINKELVSEILSFGADIEVLHPDSLRERIIMEVEKMTTKYTARK